MKYLKKFNESMSKAERNIEVHNILKDIFSELIDDQTIQVEIRLESINMLILEIKPWGINQMMASEMMTDQMINRYEKYLELVKDIEVCYKRSLDELKGVTSKLNVAVDNRIYIYFNISAYKPNK